MKCTAAGCGKNIISCAHLLGIVTLLYIDILDRTKLYHWNRAGCPVLIGFPIQRYICIHNAVWWGLQTVSSIEMCPLFRVPSTESSAVLHLLDLYQQMCNNNKLDVYICHNLKENMLAIAVVQIRFNNRADYMKC